MGVEEPNDPSSADPSGIRHFHDLVVVVTEPKVHHYVPRFYLRGFANNNDRLAVRERSGRTYVTSTRNVMARSGLFRVGQTLLTAEHTLADIEATVSRVIGELREGTLPRRGTSERATLAIFLAVQLARGLNIMPMLDLLLDLWDRFGSLQITTQDMRTYLTSRHGFAPANAEIEAAKDMTYIWGKGSPSPEELKAFMLKLMFDAIREVTPFLEARQWSLEASKGKNFITSDRPVVLWNPPTPEDSHLGVGIARTKEIWFPVDRSRILILRIDGSEMIRRIGPERVRTTNEHIARHCTERIVSHPEAAKDLMDCPLAKRRPPVRFNRAPAVDSKSGADLGHEILHVWAPIRDIPDDVEVDA